MRIGTGLGPADAARHQSTHYVYDVRSGTIVAVHHFAGAAARSEAERRTLLLRTSHQASGIALEHLDVLTGQDVPAGTGELQVDPASRRLLRKQAIQPARLSP